MVQERLVVKEWAGMPRLMEKSFDAAFPEDES